MRSNQAGPPVALRRWSAWISITPKIESFILWKAKEEQKVAALIAAGYPSDYEGEAYATVSGQNSNNSVRVPDTFFSALAQNRNWDLRARTDGSVIRSVSAQNLEDIGDAAWHYADPGLQFDTTINDWHTCPNGGRIRASNPCSEEGGSTIPHGNPRITEPDPILLDEVTGTFQ